MNAIIFPNVYRRQNGGLVIGVVAHSDDVVVVGGVDSVSAATSKTRRLSASKIEEEIHKINIQKVHSDGFGWVEVNSEYIDIDLRVYKSVELNINIGQQQQSSARHGHQ